MKLPKGKIVCLNAEWYSISEFIDKGCFAHVYKVEKISTDEFFALKIMKPGLSKRSFDREIACMKKLDHPNVTKFYESGVLLGLKFILMEYVHGMDLFKWIMKYSKAEGGQFDHILNQLFDVLDYIHSNNIVHRDVKIENVLCTDSEYPEVKIADFGLASTVNGALLTDYCGSPLYVAPEVMEHTPYSFPVDVWGLGVVAYTLRLGFLPINDTKGDIDKALQVIEAEEYFEEEHFDFLPIPVQTLLRGLLTRDPKQRLTIAEAKNFLAKNFWRKINAKNK